MKTDGFSRQVLQIAGLGVWQVVTGQPMVKRLETVEDPRWDRKTGVFVTLKHGLQVRGSVGLLESSTSLQETLFDAGQSAATHDHRFQPVSQPEIDHLSMEVTLIENTNKLVDVSVLDPHKHGLIVSKGEKRSVLLPQVAIEQNWNAREYLEAACEKAGLPHSDWQDANTLVEFFSCEFLTSPNLMNDIREFVLPSFTIPS